MRRIQVVLIALAGCVLPGVEARALTVKNTNDSGAGSLRQAIADAKPGDTIDCPVKGVITLTSGELSVGKNLVISGPGAGALSISGGKSSRVFNITDGTVTLSGLTIRDGKTGGSPARGGGIYNNGALTLQQAVVSGNRAEGAAGQSGYGGGVYNNGTLTVANSTISGNTAQGGDGTAGGNGARGGGICTVGALTVANSVISGNTAAGGNSSGPGRAGEGEGGGIFCYNNCAVKFDATTISGNKAVSGNATGTGGIGGYATGGGVIQNWPGGTGTRTFTNCTISGNVTQGGTGVMADSVSRGGGIWETSSATFVHCTVVGNKTLGRFQEGGGMYCAGAAGEGPVIKACVFAGNAAASGPDLRGNVRSQDSNLIGGAGGCTVSGEAKQNVVGQDPKLGPLADNGGPTQTHVPQAGSPLLDQVPPDAAVPVDQRGVKRPQAAKADIGACELDTVPPNATAIAAATPSPTNSKSAGFTVTFDEEVRNLNAETDLVIKKAGKATYAGVAITGGPLKYTVTITNVKGDGTITTAVKTDSDVRDMAGNPLASSVTSAPIVVDNTPPTVTTVTPAVPSPTNVPSLQFAVAFSEGVQKFDVEPDLVVTQTGTVAHTGVAIAGGPQNYTVDVTGLAGDGTIALAVNKSSDVHDLAGNALASSVISPVVAVDHTPPTMTLAAGTPTPTNAAAALFNVTFSEVVAPMFKPESIALTGTLGAAATAQIGGADPAYTVTATPNDPKADGTLGIVAGKGVTDPAGNALTAAASPLITFDHTPPSVAANLATPSPTNADAVVFNATFSEPVAPTFALEDIALTGTLGAAATAQIGGTDPAYTITATPKDPQADGTIGIMIGTAVTDAAGNALAARVTSPVATIDNTAPSATIAAATPSPTNADAIVFNVTFSEPVAPTFKPESLALTGTLASAATAQIGGTDPAYAVTVTPTDPKADGTFGIAIGTAVADPAGNALAARVTGPLVTIDNTAPSVAINLTTPNPTNADAATFGVTFSEPVAPTFKPESFALTGTLSSAVTAQFGGTDPVYAVTVKPTDPKASGTVGITIASLVADAAGNTLSGPAAGPLATFDHTPPAATIALATPSPATAEAVVFNVTFSEPVAPTFKPETLALTGTLAPAASVQLGGADPAYTVTAKPSDPKANGTIGIKIGAGVTDAVGNPYPGGASDLCTK